MSDASAPNSRRRSEAPAIPPNGRAPDLNDDYDAEKNSRESYNVAIDAMREKLESFRCERIGDAKLYLGDCQELLPLLPKVDAVVTDPPYGNANHDGDYNASLNEHRGLENKPIANDTEQSMREVVDAMLTHCAKLMSKKASACCCFCGGGGAAACVCLACRQDGSERLAVLSLSYLGQEKPRPWSTLQKAA